MRILIVVTCFLLIGCEPKTPVRNPIATSMRVNLHWSDDLNAVARTFGDETAERDGYAVLREISGELHCDIYVAEPIQLGTTTQTLIGHELMHCIYGDYHQ